jgi:MBOAT, membrane-bound O-acyltransferase family
MRGIPFPLAWSVASSAALAGSMYFVIVRSRGIWRYVAVSATCAAVFLTPWVIPGERAIGRLLAGMCAVAVIGKVIDLGVGAKRNFVPGWGKFVGYLAHLSLIVLRKADREPVTSRSADLKRILVCFINGCVGMLAVAGIWSMDWRGLPFALEHVAKVFAFYLLLMPVSTAGAVVYRLFGLPTVEPMNNPIGAATSAEFWRRWNRAAAQFFYEDVFKPLGGYRRPIRNTMLTFLVSGLIHEYLFDQAAGRIQGLQLCFFLVQGLAAVLTWKIRPRGWRRAPWVVGTLMFNLATSVLFFASGNEIVPFYSRPVPWPGLWLGEG